MAFYALTILAAAVSAVSAATPSGFRPATNNQLVVNYGNTLINGQVVAKNLVGNQPRIGTQQRLTGSSYAVIMVDLDIPTNNPRQTTTLLHWMQMGLTSSSQTTNVGGGNNGNGQNQQQEKVFLLQSASNVPAAAAYISPNPPARLPLSHRYTQILVDTSGVSLQSSAMTSLMNAAKTRQGFNVNQVLTNAGLQNKVVAANFFNVTNPGPVNRQQDGALINADGGGNGTGAGNSTGKGGSTGTATKSSPSATSSPIRAGAANLAVSGAAAVVGLLACAFAI